MIAVKTSFILVTLASELAFGGVNTKLVACASQARALMTFAAYCVPGGGLYRSPIRFDDAKKAYTVRAQRDGKDGSYALSENDCTFVPNDGSKSSAVCDSKAYSAFADGLSSLLSDLVDRTQDLVSMKTNDGTPLSRILSSQNTYQDWSSKEFKDGANCRVPDADAWPSVVSNCNSVEDIKRTPGGQKIQKTLKRLARLTSGFGAGAKAGTKTAGAAK